MRAAGPLGLALLLAPAAVGLQGAPDDEWFTSHGGSRAQSHGHYVLACSDGGFLQVGETGFVGSDARLLVVKTDSAGGLLWKKEFGSGNKNMGNSALEVDDGYVICGMLSRNSALLKLDKDTGATLLQRTHDIGGADAFDLRREVRERLARRRLHPSVRRLLAEKVVHRTLELFDHARLRVVARVGLREIERGGGGGRREGGCRSSGGSGRDEI